MEPKFNTSFIPKKSLQADVGGPGSTTTTSPGNKYVKRRTVRGPGYFLTLLIFVLAVVASFSIYGYTVIVERNIDDRIAQINEMQKGFDPSEIERLAREGLRMKNAERLLSSHVTVTELFDLLEAITLKNVRYDNFEYSGALGSTPGLDLSGSSQNFQSIAVQTEQYRINQSLNNPVVTELKRLTDGSAVFDVQMTVNPRLVSFPTALQAGKRTLPVSQPEEVVPAETSTEQVDSPEPAI